MLPTTDVKMSVALTAPWDAGIELVDDPLFESVSPVRLDRRVFQLLESETDRTTRAYKPAIWIIQILTDAGGPSLGGETGPRLPGFLFDLNRFFQALLAKFLYITSPTIPSARSTGSKGCGCDRRMMCAGKASQLKGELRRDARLRGAVRGARPPRSHRGHRRPRPSDSPGRSSHPNRSS